VTGREASAPGLMVCGTGSDCGKSTLVAGLCRVLARRGLRVAPFKAQNMALNSAVTSSGHEIGRAQAAQAAAARVEAEVAMNPILLKPTGSKASQVVVNGRAWAVLDASSYQRAKADLWPVVVEALDDLRARFDAVVCEGAGSPAEINLLDADIVNLRVARHAGFPALVVGDIDRGGVFAALHGTVDLLPPDLRAVVAGFVINKFRGDPALLTAGLQQLEQRTKVPTLGVIPWLDGPVLDAEDSLTLAGLAGPGGGPLGGSAAPGGRAVQGRLDVAVVRFPRISNYTDVDPLRVEPAVAVRFVGWAADLGKPHVVILPGTKTTVADLEWLRRTGLAGRIAELVEGGRTTVLGICGGCQMLGTAIRDEHGVEAQPPGELEGLGMLAHATTFEPAKTTRSVAASVWGQEVRGYEIHHGTIEPAGPWYENGAVAGTPLHGLFDADGFRRAFLAAAAARAGLDWEPGPPVSFAGARDARHDLVADAIEANLDVDAVLELIRRGAR
jgi:adenosylcobyric acid synthase